MKVRVCILNTWAVIQSPNLASKRSIQTTSVSFLETSKPGMCPSMVRRLPVHLCEYIERVSGKGNESSVVIPLLVLLVRIMV